MTLEDSSNLKDSVIAVNEIPPETSSRCEDMSIVGTSQQEPAETSSPSSSLPGLVPGTRPW